MLISEVADHVRNSVGDRGGIFTSDPLIILWCNEAVSDIYRETDIGPTTFVEETFTPGSATWVADRILRINTIFKKESTHSLEEKSLDWIISYYGPSYYVERGTPRYYFTYLSAGSNGITLVPTPDVETQCVINYTALPDKFTATTDTLDNVLPENMFYDVIQFCIMRAHEKEKDFRASEKAQEHYLANVAKRKDEAHRLDDDFFSITPDPYDYL